MVKSAKKRAKNIKRIRLERERTVFMKLGAKLRAYFFTGILVTAPVSITFYMAYKIFVWIDVSVNHLIPPELIARYNIPLTTIPGIGIVILILAMIFIGMFAAGFVGRFFLHLGDWIVRRLPVISSIYSLLKQVFETMFSDKKQSFNKCVLLEYPRKGIWILGFVSAETKGEIKKELHEELLSVFIPTTPNPTSGFLIFVPKKDVIPLSMSVEQGIKFVISCGIVEPDKMPR
ncbi:MAG: DUF502 domain-containing protein [Pseudomonadota bacterium]|nr:DUF502 domain-containing protein [Pseudomonadota bacterium]